MFEKTIIDIELERRIAERKDELEERFEISFDKLDKALIQIADGVAYCNLTNWKKVEEVWNVAGFVVMTYYDLKILLKESWFSTNEWRKRYFARQACLLVFEAKNDIPTLIGNKFIKQTVNLLSESDIHIEQLRGIKQEISEYTKKHHGFLKGVRDSCTAHRDHSMLEQVLLINKLSWSAIMPILSEFHEILTKLFDFMQELMNKSQVEFLQE